MASSRDTLEWSNQRGSAQFAFHRRRKKSRAFICMEIRSGRGSLYFPDGNAGIEVSLLRFPKQSNSSVGDKKNKGRHVRGSSHLLLTFPVSASPCLSFHSRMRETDIDIEGTPTRVGHFRGRVGVPLKGHGQFNRLYGKHASLCRSIDQSLQTPNDKMSKDNRLDATQTLSDQTHFLPPTFPSP